MAIFDKRAEGFDFGYVGWHGVTLLSH